MPTVRLPAAFSSYGCKRTLVCCKHPLRAPCDETEEARIAKVLASTDAGRAHLPILHGGFELERDLRVFQQVDERCVQLAPPREDREAGCSLHFLGGTDGLAPACRNYPRWVTQLPSEPGSDAALEVVFVLSCPTAGALLVADPSPFRWVERPLEGWIYTSTRETTAAEIDAVRDLRAGWWQVLAERRDDPERLLAVLAAMYTDPCQPPAKVLPGPPPERFLKAFWPFVRFASDALDRLPERGATYGYLPFDLWRDVTRDISARELLDGLDIAPALVTAFVDHQVPYAGIHDGRPVHDWLRTTVRRALVIARLADSLLARVPFGIDTLFADLFGASMFIDATGTHAED